MLKTTQLSAGVTVTRPVPAPYIDKNGAEQTSPADTARFNWYEGQPDGLMLDSLLEEQAALVAAPAFNSDEGTWFLGGFLENCRPLPGAGFDELVTGEGMLVFVYKDGVGKCWAGGQVLYTVDPITPAVATALTAGGAARVAHWEYKPHAITDGQAAARSTGTFEIVTPPSLLADLQAQEYGTRDESGAFQRKPYSGVLDLTRPGPTTVWDAQGQLVTVPSGQPAFDHGPVTGEPLGQQIVVFPVTNMCPDSHDLTTGNWISSSGVVASLTGDPRFPDWSVSDVVFPASGSDTIMMGSIFATGVYSCRRVIFKPQDPTKVIRISARSTGTFDSNFLPATETVVSSDGRNPVNSIRSIGDGWYVALMVHNGTENFSTSTQFGFGYVSAGLDAAQTVRIAQVDCFETAALQTLEYYEGLPSVLTDGTAATRAADYVESIEAFQSTFNPQAFTLFFDYEDLQADNVLWGAYGPTTINTGMLIYRAAVTGRTVLRVENNGTALIIISAESNDASRPFGKMKVAVSGSSDSNVINYSINGSSNTGTDPGLAAVLQFIARSWWCKTRPTTPPAGAINLGQFWIDDKVRTPAELEAITGAGA